MPRVFFPAVPMTSNRNNTQRRGTYLKQQRAKSHAGRKIYCRSCGDSMAGRRPFPCFIMLMGTKVFDRRFVMMPYM